MRSFFSIFRFLLKRIADALSSRPVTIEYPFVSKPLPQMARTRIKNNFADCTGCLKCEASCPTSAIKITATEFPYKIGLPKTSKGVDFERNTESFEIDYGQCVFCGVCVLGCPTGSLSFERKLSDPQVRFDRLKVDLVHIPRSMRRSFNP